MKKFITCLAVSFFAVSLASCNTIRGAGQDIENAGQTVQDATD